MLFVFAGGFFVCAIRRDDLPLNMHAQVLDFGLLCGGPTWSQKLICFDDYTFAFFVGILKQGEYVGSCILFQ